MVYSRIGAILRCLDDRKPPPRPNLTSIPQERLKAGGCCLVQCEDRLGISDGTVDKHPRLLQGCIWRRELTTEYYQ